MNKKQINSFIDNKIKEIAETVGDKKAVSLLSGGVDSSVVTLLAHKALGNQLATYFIDTGFMRKGEPEYVRGVFMDVGIDVNVHNASDDFLIAFHARGCRDGTPSTDGEDNRRIFSNTFYEVSNELIQASGAEYLFQGTNAADLIMTKKGQGQHNVRTKKDYKELGIRRIIEPVIDLYKPEVRKVGKALGLPEELYNRNPFPGPGLMVRCLGEIDKEKINIVREAQYIAEQELAYLKPSQVIACVSGDQAKMMTAKGKVDKGYIIFIRPVKSKDFVTAEGIHVPEETVDILEKRIREIPGVARVVMDSIDKKANWGGTVEYI
jgi:GMP synthase (glutamine-hydrolysing)